MTRRLTSAILLLYPRRVRERHGPEIVALIDDLITHDKRSRLRLLIRLAGDGLTQRMATTVTACTAVAVLAATTTGGLAASDFASANALQTVQHAAHITAAPHTHQTLQYQLSNPSHALRSPPPPTTPVSCTGRVTMTHPRCFEANAGISSH